MPKLSDFGHFRAWEYTLTMMKTTNPERHKGIAPWAAYELVKSVQDPAVVTVVCTEASDMWAFGMVLYVSICLCAFTCSTTKPFLAGDVIRTSTLRSIRRCVCNIHSFQRDFEQGTTSKARKLTFLWRQSLGDMSGLLELRSREPHDCRTSRCCASTHEKRSV